MKAKVGDVFYYVNLPHVRYRVVQSTGDEVKLAALWATCSNDVWYGVEGLLANGYRPELGAQLADDESAGE